MEGRLEEFKAALQALIERKVAPLEKEIQDQAEQIQRLTEQISAFPASKPGLRKPEEAKRPRTPAEEAKAPKVSPAEARKAKEEAAAEAKKAKDEAAAEAKRAKAEEAKKKAEEEKARKAEAKKAQDEAAKKKAEEAKAAKEKAKLEAEEKKKEMEAKRAEEKKKKEGAGKPKPPEVGKKPGEESKKGPKKAAKKPEEGKVEEKPETDGQKSPPQDTSLEAVESNREQTEPAQGPSSRPATEESEPIAIPDVQTAVEGEMLIEDPQEEQDEKKEEGEVEQPAFVEEEAQPSAPENEAEDHTQELQEIEDELQRLVETVGDANLQKCPPFQLSLGAKSAMSLLNTLDEAQLYLHTLPPREETMWVFRLFFQLCGETLPDDKAEAWDICQVFLSSGQGSGMERKVQEAVASFDFSNENIDKVDKVLAGRVDKVNPNMYNQFCTLTGLIMFTVKEGVTYSGLLPEKVAPWRKYQRLLYRKQKLLS